jgi:hypothetical protein
MRAPHLLQLISSLAGEGEHAPRVLTASSLNSLLRSTLGIASPRALNDARRTLVVQRVLTRVTRGLYLNNRCIPRVVPAEAAPYLRAGAVVSLQYVLGEAGVLNNPTAVVTAVVPLPKRSKAVPRTGVVATSAARFRFHGMPERFFNLLPTDLNDHRQLKPYPCATPERALMDWIYLGLSPRAALTPPPLELDLSDLDIRRLRRVARYFHLEDELQALLARIAEYSESPNVKEQANTSLGV